MHFSILLGLWGLAAFVIWKVASRIYLNHRHAGS
jgi:hypothetical protein